MDAPQILKFAIGTLYIFQVCEWRVGIKKRYGAGVKQVRAIPPDARSKGCFCKGGEGSVKYRRTIATKVGVVTPELVGRIELVDKLNAAINPLPGAWLMHQCPAAYLFSMDLSGSVRFLCCKGTGKQEEKGKPIGSFGQDLSYFKHLLYLRIPLPPGLQPIHSGFQPTQAVPAEPLLPFRPNRGFGCSESLALNVEQC